MHICPGCGYAKLEFAPEDFTICPSCGTEFGYQDATRSYYDLCQDWIAGGLKWHSRVEELPFPWNPYNQLITSKMPYETKWLESTKVIVIKTLASIWVEPTNHLVGQR